jgi:hypothetical protein
VKNQLPLQFMEKVWFMCLILHLCPQVIFPFKKQFSHGILSKLMEKRKQVYVPPKLEDCTSTTTNFQIWMSKEAHDIFACVINFLKFDWQLKQMTIGLFETTKTIGQTLATNLIEMFNQYGLG